MGGTLLWIFSSSLQCMSWRLYTVDSCQTILTHIYIKYRHFYHQKLCQMSSYVRNVSCLILPGLTSESAASPARTAKVSVSQSRRSAVIDLTRASTVSLAARGTRQVYEWHLYLQPNGSMGLNYRNRVGCCIRLICFAEFS
jgi:hypothetical protein